MEDVKTTLSEHIERFEDPERRDGDFTALSKRWASHSLETYTGNLLTKALDVSKALVEFETEMLPKDQA